MLDLRETRSVPPPARVSLFGNGKHVEKGDKEINYIICEVKVGENKAEGRMITDVLWMSRSSPPLDSLGQNNLKKTMFSHHCTEPLT